MLIVFIIILIAFVSEEITKTLVVKSYLEGYWEATPAFCLKAAITSAHAYFASDAVYFLILENTDKILNKTSKFDLMPQLINNVGKFTNLKYSIKFDEDMDPLENCTMKLSLDKNFMWLYNNNILLMEMTKKSV